MGTFESDVPVKGTQHNQHTCLDLQNKLEKELLQLKAALALTQPRFLHGNAEVQQAQATQASRKLSSISNLADQVLVNLHLNQKKQ